MWKISFLLKTNLGTGFEGPKLWWEKESKVIIKIEINGMIWNGDSRNRQVNVLEINMVNSGAWQ